MPELLSLSFLDMFSYSNEVVKRRPRRVGSKGYDPGRTALLHSHRKHLYTGCVDGVKECRRVFSET